MLDKHESVLLGRTRWIVSVSVPRILHTKVFSQSIFLSFLTSIIILFFFTSIIIFFCTSFFIFSLFSLFLSLLHSIQTLHTFKHIHYTHIYIYARSRARTHTRITTVTNLSRTHELIFFIYPSSCFFCIPFPKRMADS